MDNDATTQLMVQRMRFDDEIRQENIALKLKIRELESKLLQIQNFVMNVYKGIGW
jgi:hypothetical protein